ncbi:MAG: DegV family protein [Slackia sp.]|nr:DegV family protein [Slackia sp.]
MESVQKIAVLTDSCSDVPTDIVDELGIRVVAMHINYRDASYRDRVDIQPDEVYARFAEEIPRTSTPSPADVAAVFDALHDEGVTHVVAVVISSGLSATHDLIKSVAAGHPDLTTEVIDTKNIGLGSGFTAIEAAHLVRQGLSFDEVVARTRRAAESVYAFFCVDTLEYLYQGGRIGKVTYSVGSALDVRPVITCDAEGKYVPIAKAHGRKSSLKKALSAVKKHAAGAKRYRLAVVHGGALEEAQGLLAAACEALPDAEEVLFNQISPALVVHTGPGLIGIGVQVLER